MSFARPATPWIRSVDCASPMTVHLNPDQQVEEKIVERKKIQNSKKPLKFNLLGDNCLTFTGRAAL